MARINRKILDEFFYNNYQRCWPQASAEQMQPIYFNEIECLLRAFEDNRPYHQEFAQDYRLKAILAPQNNNSDQETSLQPTDARHQTEYYCPPTVELQPYTILPTADGVVFKYYNQELMVLTFFQFFLELQNYIDTLAQKYPESYQQMLEQDRIRQKQIQILLEDANSPIRTEFACKQSRQRAEILQRLGRWQERLTNLKQRNWKKFFQQLVPKPLRFWLPKEVPSDAQIRFTGSRSVVLKPGGLLSFTQLDCADTLTSLNAVALTNYLDLDILGQYTKLKTLRLCHMQIKDISFVSQLKELEELILLNNKITDLSPIQGLPKLNHLYLAANPIDDFSVLSTLPSLQRLYVDSEQMPDDFSLSRVPEQVTVTVVKVILLEPDPKTPLEPNTTVDIVTSRQGKKVKALSSAKTMVPLDNGTGSGVSSLKIQPQPDPRKLQISDRFLYSGLFNSLGFTPCICDDLRKVKTLDCSNYIALQPDHMFLAKPGDFSCLKNAINLRQLNLSGRKLNSFDWLSHCTKLQKLDLSCTNFKDLSLLSNLKDLQELNLKDCKELILEDSALSQLALINVVHLDEHQEQQFNLFGRALESFILQSSRLGLKVEGRSKTKLRFENKEKLNRIELFMITTTALLPDLRMFSIALNYPGLLDYMQFIANLGIWKGEINLKTTDAQNLPKTNKDTEVFKIWLLNKETVKDTKFTYPWSKDFEKIQPEFELYQLHQQKADELEEQIEKILEESNDPQLCEQFDTICNDLYDGFEVDTDHLSAKLRYLVELQKMINDYQEEQMPQLPKYWRNYFPFIMVQHQLNGQTTISNLETTNTSNQNSIDKSEHLKQQFTNWKYYLIEKSKGKIFELSYTPHHTLRQVSPNLVYFMLNWSKIVLNRSFEEAKQDLVLTEDTNSTNFYC